MKKSKLFCFIEEKAFDSISLKLYKCTMHICHFEIDPNRYNNVLRHKKNKLNVFLNDNIQVIYIHYTSLRSDHAI